MFFATTKKQTEIKTICACLNSHLDSSQKSYQHVKVPQSEKEVKKQKGNIQNWNAISLNTRQKIANNAEHCSMKRDFINCSNITIRKLLITLLIMTMIGMVKSQCSTTYHQFYNYISGQCEPCSQECLTCLDSSVCVLCRKQYYLNEIQGNCEHCPFGCQSCVSGSSCQSCNSGMYIDNEGNCLPCGLGVKSCSIAVVQSCHSGYFLLGDICAGCLDECSVCEDFVTCRECQPGYYLQAGRQKCLTCPPNCALCNGVNTCVSCSRGYEIDSAGVCVPSDCTSQFPFCRKCSSLQCLICEQGKYLDVTGKCQQSASVLCEEASGPNFTNCQIDDYGCPAYTVVQKDPYTNADIGVCLPYSASQSQEVLYYSISSETNSNCLSTTCTEAFWWQLTISAKQAFYQLSYHLSLRLYSATEHTVTVQAIDSSNSVSPSITHTINIAQELSLFSAEQPGCSGCLYGQVYTSGTLKGASGSQKVNLNISDLNGSFTVMEAVLVLQICSVDNCGACTTASDCTLCTAPYLLQLTQCVISCDAGFYKFEGKHCLLTCPAGSYPIQSTYQCAACMSPCESCHSTQSCISCEDGFFLQGDQCLVNCVNAEFFGNSSSKHCQLCPNPCHTCERSAQPEETVSCLSCKVGYLWNGQSCVFVCPDGQFGQFTQISQCLACDPTCLSCHIDNTTCSGCINGYLLYSERICTLESECESGYYPALSLNNTCQPCQFPCSTCRDTATYCTSCFRGALLSNSGKCLMLCPLGFYADYAVSEADSINCQSCQPSCTSCISLDICNSCANGYYLHGLQCLAACPLPTVYAESSNNSCVGCVSPCKTCSSASVCLSCSTGYLQPQTGSCTLRCNSSSYISEEFVCTQCPAPCTRCHSEVECWQCDISTSQQYVLSHQGSSCLSRLECTQQGMYIAEYFNNQSLLFGECRPCTYPCRTCDGSGIVCTSCQDGYMHVPDVRTCQEQCPLSYYSDTTGKVCIICSSNCYQCNMTSNTCTACSAGAFLNVETSSCVQTCPTGWYPDNEARECLQCALPCLECYNVYFCKSCTEGILYGKSCVDKCPSSTIPNPDQNSCDPCSDNCLACVSTASNCSACISGNFLNTQNNSCETKCPDGTYPDLYSSVCESCISPCQTCLGTGAEQCQSCVLGYFLVGSQGPASCVSNCLKGTFQDSSSRSCMSCNLTICETCENEANKCLSCAESYFFDSTALKCVQSCGRGKFQDESSRSCKACSYPCSECSNSSHCSECEASYKLHGNWCYSSCPVGYSSSTQGRVCEQCPDNCQLCSSIDTCDKCLAPYSVEDRQCVVQCSMGKYPGKQDITNYDHCLNCAPNCSICEHYNVCQQCSNGLLLFNGLCLSECPILHFNGSSKCQPCPANCNTCSNSTHCSECLSSYLFESECYLQCPTGTYGFNGQTCLECVAPCKECLSEFMCVSCVENYFFYADYCVTACPSDVWYYPHNQSCGVFCDGNKYEANRTCYIKGCGGRLVEHQGYCVQSCPNGDYFVSRNHSCLLCNQVCDQGLFIADLKALRSQQLTLVLYFNQKVQIPQGLEKEIRVFFRDQRGKALSAQITPVLKETQLDPYAFKLRYLSQDSPLSFVDIAMSIPYLQSLSSEQAISYNQFLITVYYFNNYGLTVINPGPKTSSFPMAQSTQNVSMINQQPIQSQTAAQNDSLLAEGALIIGVGVLTVMIVNMLSGKSYFLQMLDFMQLVGAMVYLEIQYPPWLEQFFARAGRTVLLGFLPTLVQPEPYIFSPSKFIYHHVDISFTRTCLCAFIFFLAMLLIQIIALLLHSIKPSTVPEWLIRRVRYRHLNDVFSLFALPLLLFSCSAGYQTQNFIDVLLAVITLLFVLAFVALISMRILQAQEMGELQGLLSDYQPVQNRLGLMYTPFAYVRRFVVALVLCLFPEKPLATLTLLLIFTVLILICLFLYQPFANQITDYVVIMLEIGFVLLILGLAIIGLDVLTVSATEVLSYILIVICLICMVVGLGWLLYLSFIGFRDWWTNKDKLNQNVKADQDCVISSKKNEQGFKQEKQESIQNSEHEQEHNSASNLIMSPSQFKHGFQQEEGSDNFRHSEMDGRQNSPSESQQISSNKEEFKHWNNDEWSAQGNSEQNSVHPRLNKYNRNFPEMLIKKTITSKVQNQSQNMQG